MEEKIRELLSKYPFEVKHLYRGRGAWLCETNQGLKLIRPYYGSPKRVEWEMMVKSELRKRGCIYIDQFVQSEEGEYLIEDEEEVKYVVTDWYSGKECNTRDKQEILKAVIHMAGIHKQMHDFSEEDDFKQVFRSENLLEEMNRRSKEFKMIRNYVAHKKQKNDFDRKFMEVYGTYAEDGERAKEMLKDMDYPLLYESVCKETGLCHGDYNQHNILMLKGETALVRFDKMHMELQIYDLYVFIRKILEKNRWNASLGLAMVSAYHRVRPITYREVRCLYSMLLFPEKFWKVINRYHNTRKSWMSAQNMSKLDKLIREQGFKNQFLEELALFCEKIE